jgi:hypothetical protein
MAKIRSLIPVRLFVVIVFVFIAGAAAGPIIAAVTTEQQLARNIMLVGLPFILIFIGIVLTFIGIIAIAARALSNNIPPRVYRIIESVLIAGIVLGVFSIYQPWFFTAYRYGFIVLLISTLGFILWSHVLPKREMRRKHAAAAFQGDGPGLKISADKVE